MIKSRLTDGAVLVGFELSAAVSAGTVSVCGDFNDWSPLANPLTRASDGSFFAFVQLPAGRRWQFRYLLDGERWENDWAADGYVGNQHGGEDSVVDLTDVSALPMAEVTQAVGAPGSAPGTSTGSATAGTSVPAGAGRSTNWFRRLIGRSA